MFQFLSYLPEDFNAMFFDRYTPYKILLISFILALFVNYPNIANLSWHLTLLDESLHASYIQFFIFRFLFLAILIWLLIRYNLRTERHFIFRKRLIYNTIILILAFTIYAGFAYYVGPKFDAFTSTILFQFFVTLVVCTLVGHISQLYLEQRKKEQEIEQLKIENLQSRYNALTSQINPHFFFNSLNGLSSLIRKNNEANTLAYLNKLSDVFRYILQSEKKGLVSVEEELAFVQAFLYLMEIRFAKKLIFNIKVDQKKKGLKIPVLSLLPLIDNIVVHNMIDRDHKMEVSIFVDDNKELVVTNPIFPKLAPPETSGTGLKNLEVRYSLLMNKQIRIENNGELFKVYLPLM